MNIVLDVLVGGVCLAMVVAGVIWQGMTYASLDKGGDSLPIRLWIGFPIGALLAFGYVFVQIANWFSSEPSNTFLGTVGVFLSILAVTLVWHLKNVVGQFLVGISAAWATYRYYVAGEFDVLPLFGWVVDFLLYWAPPSIQIAYVAGSFVVFIVSGILALLQFDW